MISDSQVRYELLIRRIEQQYARRTRFLMHLVLFLLTTILTWGIWLATTQPPRSRPLDYAILFLTLAWAVGMVLHAVSVVIAGVRERAIHKAVAAVAGDTNLAFEKPKNDRRMRLTEDGELEEVPDDEISQAEKQKRSR